MPSSIYLAASAAALLGFAQISQAQTNITSHACASGSEYTSCNRKVADDWSSCIRNCNGNGNCIVDCGCISHQAYINCMAQTCWNQVYSCEYQLFVQQYFAICPSASEPIPFWPAPDNAPNRCSCDLGKVIQSTLTARNEQISCIKNVTSQTLDKIPSDLGDLSNLPNGLRHRQASFRLRLLRRQRHSWEVCPNTEPTLAGADLWPLFFPSDLPNLYTSVPNWAWSSCDSTLKDTDCKKIGFTDSSDKFYRPGDLPSNGTSTLRNVGGTVTAPPSGTVLTWSQSSTSWTVTATGYDRKAVSSQSEYRATATGTDVFETQTGTNVANGYAATPVAAMFAGVGVVGALMM
ncbi:hypothetical protein N7533_008919 [Penicillium manginii]|uniref:uncharacterized protein n=1 Tax=Penicillium manginii TaxID=203109 RepID=UPI002547845E|nr:uncharacterized protein N7533_008919 [Penicillium manginii]KAJ5744049.1 hypothetical protein N7533_008919 [Penicillium manginii]